MASSNWMWAAAEEIHTRMFEFDNAASEYAIRKYPKVINGGIAKRVKAVHEKWTELAAEVISKHYMKCPSCEGEGGMVQVDEHGDDAWHDCEECHGTGEMQVPF